MRVFFYVKIYAFLSVSINHVEYFKGKYGMLYTENILRKGVQIFQKSTKEDVKICRVSENIFYFWLIESVELEIYIQQLKEAFRKKRGRRGFAIFLLEWYRNLRHFKRHFLMNLIYCKHYRKKDYYYVSNKKKFLRQIQIRISD